MTKVAASRQRASSQPMEPTLSTKISGSMEGEASQKDITGARGTPLTSRAVMMGMTPQEQKGLRAPTKVAMSTAR